MRKMTRLCAAGLLLIGCLSGCTISPSNENHKEKKDACVILHEDTSGIAYRHYFIPVDANTGFQDEIEFVKTFE